MPITNRHFRSNLPPNLAKPNHQTDSVYKNNALGNVLSEIPYMDKDTTIQAIKCTIREINGGNNINHDHSDLDRLGSVIKDNTQIITANASSFFGMNKTRGAIIQLFSLCVHLAKLLDPPVHITYNPTRIEKAQLIRTVLLHPTVSGDGLIGLEDKNKLITEDLNVMFIRNRDGNIWDLELGNNSYLDHCHIEPNNNMRVGTANNHAAKGYYFNAATPRKLLSEALDTNNYSNTIKDKMLSCFDNRSSSLDLSNCGLTETPTKILSRFFPHLQELNLSGNRISEIKENAFARLNSLQKLELSSNQISEIKENAFAGLNSLHTLGLSENKISEIKENAFAGLNGLQRLDLFKNQISEIKENAFVRLNSLHTLRLSSNQISEIKENAFAGLNSLHTLSLSKNKISEIKENVFAGLNSLHMLSLSENKISEIKENTFARLNSLQRLNLSHNLISEIKENAFAGLNSLHTLGLSENKIREIKENAFAGLNSLHTLGLSENKIREIKENAFAGLNSLHTLELFSNQISEIKENAFVGLNSLHTLNLFKNQISEIKENAFAGLNSLHMLNLYKNQISEIKENAFVGLNSLQRLELSSNQISEIKENAFAGLNSLHTLSLSYNQISEIKENAFVRLNSLHTLELSSNQISEIKENAFAGLNSLQRLNLSHNLISEIKENAFAGLNSLYTLELSSNQISEIKENAFAGLNSLHTLSLSENEISEIKENAFAGLNSLQRLDLFKNQIREIKENAFVRLNSLHTLRLSSNQISEIKENAFAGLNSLHTLRLSSNQISEIKENAFVRLNSLHTLELSSNKISEIKENAFAGLNSLHMLELSSNKISEIKENAFAGLNSLQRLNLSHNLISKIKENAFSSLLRAIFQNVHLKNTITNYSCIMYIKQSKIIEKYINNSSNAEVKQLCREYCLKLLLNNQLQEPEAIALLANEIHAGDIAIADVYPTKNLDWICKLLNNHNLVILPFLARNKSTFNSDEWQSVIINNNTQLVIPPPSTAIEDLLKNGLIQKFKSLGNDINGELLSNIVINPFTTGNDIIRQANNQIKGKITEILTSNQVFASEQQITNIMTQVRNKSFSIFIKKMSIKNILNHIDAILNIDAKAKDKLVDELIKINADSIQKDIVKTIYETLGIQYDDDHYTALEQFFDWPHAVREYTNTHFMEFADKTMADINQFKDQPEIYSNLILNCSPFLTYNCIKGILNTVPLEITQLCKEKLAVITQYAEVYGISDEDPIKVLFVSSNPNKVLEIEELSHLNPQSAELTLEKIHLIDLSDKNNPEKTQLNEREFNKIETSLPSWLSQSIKKQLTVANTVARVINKYFNKMITIDNINLSEDIKHKLTSIFYATSRNLGRDLNINFENKKSIMKALKDQPMENADIENDNINFFSRKFSQVVENCISRYRDARQDFEVLNMTDDELNTLPTKLIQELQSEPYLKAIEDMIKELETETIKYDSLKDIKTHEISLLLGIYFANLSSINGLGYHVDIDNRSFHRFRLYAAICLNQCVIFGSENLSADQKSGIQKEIRDLLLTAECSGQIANKLYGHYSLFGGLTERIKGILNTRMI